MTPLLIVLLSLSMSATANTVVVEDQVIDLTIRTNGGNGIRMASAMFIKESLKPLGIDVTLEFKPFGQFVGDLVHNSPDADNMDMGIVSLTSGSIPEYSGVYVTNSFFGDFMYQLLDPEVQSALANDATAPTDLSAIDNLLLQMSSETDPYQHEALIQQFNQIFHEQLLYDYKLTLPKSISSMMHGFRNPAGAQFNYNYSVSDHLKMGYGWGADTTLLRQANMSTLQLRTGSPAAPGMLDVYRIFDTFTRDQVAPMIEPLIHTQTVFDVHPGLALQWFVEDRVTFDSQYRGAGDVTSDGFYQYAEPTTSFKESSRHTFVINPDFRFSATTDVNGNPVAAHAVDANDVALALDYLLHPNSNARGDTWKNQVANYSVSTTVTTNDTITIDLYQTSVADSLQLFDQLYPLPDHLLGGDLQVLEFGTPNGTITQVDDFRYAPELTLEWQHWSSLAGNTYAGPYELTSLDWNSDPAMWFTVRDDYPLVNENTTMDTYYTNQVAFDALHSQVNSTNWPGSDLSIFAPHLYATIQDPLFWNYAGFDSTQGSDNIAIRQLAFRSIPDDNAALIAFESGQLDQLRTVNYGTETWDSHRTNSDFEVQEYLPNSYPEFVMFNLKNEHLQKYTVRKAIALAIDTQMLASGLPHTLRAPNFSVVSASQTPYYDESHGIFADMEQARQLMVNAGYNVPSVYTPPAIAPLSMEGYQPGATDDVLHLDPSLYLDESGELDLDFLVDQDVAVNRLDSRPAVVADGAEHLAPTIQSAPSLSVSILIALIAIPVTIIWATRRFKH